MGSGATKKAERVERKKKKLNALLEITKLNDKDRLKENPNLFVEEVQNLRNEKEVEDGEIEANSSVPDGPCRKRHKTNDGSVASHHHAAEERLKGNESRNIIQTRSKEFIPADDLMKLRKELRERKNLFKDIPRVLLNEMGEKALLERHHRTPLFISDIQNLIMHTQMGCSSPVRPRWCTFEKQSKISHAVVLVVEGATVYDYISSESKYSILPKMQNRVEVMSPLNYDGNLVEELATIPLSRTQRERLEKKYGSLRQAEINNGVVFRILRSIFPIELPPVLPSSNKNLPSYDRFSRTELLLSAWQMIEEGYPIPVKGELQDRFAEYKMSRKQYAEVTPVSPMWGLDCEMCLTSIGQNEVTRVSIVDENHKVVYDSLVKPPNKIINYLTQYSGITKEMMMNVTKTLENVQEDLRNLLPPDLILVGQSLNFDLHALKIMHPYVIDTSVIYNVTGVRLRKTKLSTLAERFLGEQIQAGHGHDSIEDSSSSLKLVQLKLANSVEFGDAVLLGKDISYRPKKQNLVPSTKCEEVFATSIFSYITKNKNTAAVVGKDEIISHYRPLAMIPSLNESANCKPTVKCQTVHRNDEAVTFTCNEAMYHSFLITHVKLEDDESLVDVDRWCEQILNSLANNALFIIILAGKPHNKSHGACFLHIKSSYSNNNRRTSRYNPV